MENFKFRILIITNSAYYVILITSKHNKKYNIYLVKRGFTPPQIRWWEITLAKFDSYYLNQWGLAD
jgi:hypothetical protein